MKVTLDLPDDLVRKVKVRAAVEGRRMRELVADILRTGLGNAKTLPVQKGSMVRIDEASGLPTVVCRGVRAGSVSAGKVQELIESTQEQEDLERAGLSV